MKTLDPVQTRIATLLVLLMVCTACSRRAIDLCAGPDAHPRCDDGQTADADRDSDSPDMTSAADIPDVPAFPCGGNCVAPAAICDVTSDTCVECVAPTDCAMGTCTDDNRCVECVDSSDCTAGVCDTATNLCVGCLADADCPDVTASRCDLTTNTCAPCADSAQCAHLAGSTVCNAGECVECLDDDDATRAACNGNSCDPATSACTQTPTASLLTCESCVADSECQDNYRCVPMDFDGQFHGNFCLRIRGAMPCVKPFTTQLSAASLSGAPAEPYCGVDVDATSCDAVRDLLVDPPVLCSADDECGAEGLNDGLCRSVNFEMRCTYSCATNSQCPGSCNLQTSACGEDL